MLDEYRNRRLTQELGLPDRTAPSPPNPAQRQARLYAHEVLVRNPPGYPTSDRWPLVSGYKDIVGLCVRSIMDAMASITLRVTQRSERPVARKSYSGFVRKSGPTAHSQAEDYDYVPAPYDHPLCRLLRRPNSVEPLCDWLAFWTMQNELLGESFVWMNPNVLGTHPAEMWVIPTPLTTPLNISAEYPDGGIRVMSLQAGAVMGANYFSNIEIDNAQLIRMVEPHPLYRWSAMSRQTVGGRSIDALNSILESLKGAMDGALSARTIINVPGAQQNQIDYVMNRIKEGYAGSKGKQVIGLGSEEEIKITNTEPLGARDMDYPGAYEQLVKTACALFGVSDTVIGLSAADSYAGFWAKLKQFQTLSLAPRVRRYAAHLTMHLAERYWPDDRLVVELDLPKIDDDEQLRSWVSVQPGSLYTFNELRALRNLDPVEGGDVPANTYGQQQQQPGGMDGDGGAMPGTDAGASPADDANDSPLDPVGDAIMSALEIRTDSIGRRYGIQDGKRVAITSKSMSGILTDKLGRKYRMQNGRRVPVGGASDQAAPTGKPAPVTAPGKGVGAAVSKPAGPVPEEVKRHPRVVQAVKTLTTNAATVAAKVGSALHAVGMTPLDALGTIDDWTRIFVTHHADAVAHAVGVDAMTAGHVLTHLAAHAFSAIKSKLTGGAGSDQQQPQPSSVGRELIDAVGGGQPSRPDNPDGAGSLPSRIGKAFDSLDLAAALNDYVDSL